MKNLKAPKLNPKQEKEVKDLVYKIAKGAKKKWDLMIIILTVLIQREGLNNVYGQSINNA